MRNLSPLAASLQTMNHSRRSTVMTGSRRRAALDGPGPWIVFAIGLLLMLAAAIARADESATARRTDRFNATLPSRGTVRIVNISGDVVATAGREFSAVCTTTVSAATKARAEELLGQTRIEQSRDGDEVTLESLWPDMEERSNGRRMIYRRGKSRTARCPDCRITTRFELVVPPGVRAVLQTVNGDVSVQGADGELELQSVNGNVLVRGSRRGVAAKTVNGKVDVDAAVAPAGSALELATVSGSVTLALPKEAKFELSASTMNGSIESTFPLAPSEESMAWAEAHTPPPPPATAPKAERPEAPPREPRTPRPPRRVVVERDGDETIVDVAELERELEESMRDVERQVRESTREIERSSRAFHFNLPGRQYHGSIGQGGARVRLSTLNGKILLLAAGTKESEARSLVSRSTMVVTVPRAAIAPMAPKMKVKVKIPRVEVRPHVAGELPEEDTIVRGDIAGDFLATSGSGTYRIGNVSGKVNILTRSGEIHVQSAGSAAELKSYGGDISVGRVGGEFKAQTLAGDIRAGAVGGSASVETTGGDIKVERVGGSADARTGGGDVILAAVAGSVVAETGGGEIRVVVLARDPKNGVRVRNSGGDVTLTLPSNFRGEFELQASNVDSDETAIRSEFPEVSVTRRAGTQQASGTVNGGGPKVVVRTSSGSIRIRKGPAAGS